MALPQAQYRRLEEAKQRCALHAYLQAVRQRAETRCLNEIAGRSLVGRYIQADSVRPINGGLLDSCRKGRFCLSKVLPGC